MCAMPKRARVVSCPCRATCHVPPSPLAIFSSTFVNPVVPHVGIAPLSVTQDIPQYQFDLQQILIDSFPNSTGEKLRERDTPSQISLIVLKTHLPFSFSLSDTTHSPCCTFRNNQSLHPKIQTTSPCKISPVRTKFTIKKNGIQSVRPST